MRKVVRIGTRKSNLALRQTNMVAARLQQQYEGISVEIVPIVTKGDRILDVSLEKIGDKGLFTQELENAILTGRIDMAVHSLKDMPTELPQGLAVAAIAGREVTNDVLISPKYKTLDGLPAGATVGTSSLRRMAQIRHYRPDVVVTSMRGNVDLRLKKLDDGQYDAIVLAAAGLIRLGLEDRITQVIPFDTCIPAAGQGALAIEARSHDQELRQMLDFFNEPSVVPAVLAERTFLASVEGGCQVPVGAHAEVTDSGLLTMTAVIASVDGRQVYRRYMSGRPEQAHEMGKKLARQILDAGGWDILAKLNLESS
jgi:hydroxymethylbilane synthase